MTSQTVLAIDAMGGDRGPAAVVAGLNISAKKNEALRFIVHGDEAELNALLARRPLLRERCDIRHAPTSVAMHDKPSRALRAAKGTSMWSALESVANGEAQAAVSCGNTGALMAMAMLKLRMSPGVHRPAIAVFWPSRSERGHNIVLDVGADVRADPETLVQYSVMGAEYARLGFKLDRPRVGLLNVGSEDTKGRPELREAADMVASAGALCGYDYVGFVEGGDIPSSRVDVIVTDGFTGNVALKTAEGTATFISESLKSAFKHTWLSQLGALFAYPSLRRLRKKIDPRRVNGGVFLGLNGAVVKSHGSADPTGFASAVKLAWRMAQTGFSERIAAQVAMLERQEKHGVPPTSESETTSL